MTYAITVVSKPKESNKVLYWFAMVALDVLLTSKIPLITWMGCHKLSMKIITMANVSWLTRDIQRSKEQVHVKQDQKARMTYFSLVLATILGSTSMIS